MHGSGPSVGLDIAAIQSLRHHSEGMSEGPGAGIGLESNFLYIFVQISKSDPISYIFINIDKITPGLLEALIGAFIKSLQIFSEGNPNTNQYTGLPNFLNISGEQDDHLPNDSDHHPAGHDPEHNPELHDKSNEHNNANYDQFSNFNEHLKNELDPGMHQMKFGGDHYPHEQVSPPPPVAQSQHNPDPLMYMAQ